MPAIFGFIVLVVVSDNLTNTQAKSQRSADGMGGSGCMQCSGTRLLECTWRTS
jgi:hypothetical protein